MAVHTEDLFLHNPPCLLPSSLPPQPFEPEMDWAMFSTQLRERQIPDLHVLLASISDDQMVALRVRVALWILG